MDFKGKTIVLTGASSGIGMELARLFMKEECRLALTARRKEKLDELTAEGGKAEVLTFYNDVTDKANTSEVWQKIKEEFGAPDLLILNAGVGKTVTPETFSSEPAELTFGVNFFGGVYWIEAVLPELIKMRAGYIAGVSSLADNRGYSGSGFYCASKAAFSVFLEGLAVDLKPYNIKVTTIKPGFVKTPMTEVNEFKMPFLMEAQKAARIIFEGLKKEKQVIQFPFPTVAGSKLIGAMPGFIYRKLAKFKEG